MNETRTYQSQSGECKENSFVRMEEYGDHLELIIEREKSEGIIEFYTVRITRDWYVSANCAVLECSIPDDYVISDVSAIVVRNFMREYFPEQYMRYNITYCQLQSPNPVANFSAITCVAEDNLNSRWTASLNLSDGCAIDLLIDTAISIIARAMRKFKLPIR